MIERENGAFGCFGFFGSCENESRLYVWCLSVALQLRADMVWHGESDSRPRAETWRRECFFGGGCCSFQIFIKMSFQPTNDSWLKRRVRGGVFRPKSGSGFTSISLTASTVKTTLSGQSCILNVARIWIYPNICISDWLYLWTVGINVCVCECEWRATNFLPG